MAPTIQAILLDLDGTYLDSRAQGKEKFRLSWLFGRWHFFIGGKESQ